MHISVECELFFFMIQPNFLNTQKAESRNICKKMAAQCSGVVSWGWILVTDFTYHRDGCVARLWGKCEDRCCSNWTTRGWGHNQTSCANVYLSAEEKSRLSYIKIIKPLEKARSTHSQTIKNYQKCLCTSVFLPLERHTGLFPNDTYYTYFILWRSDDLTGQLKAGDHHPAGKATGHAETWRWLLSAAVHVSHGGVLVTKPHCWTHNVSL